MSEFSESENNCSSNQLPEQIDISNLELNKCPCYKQMNSKCPCMKKKLVECPADQLSEIPNQIIQDSSDELQKNSLSYNLKHSKSYNQNSPNKTVKGTFLGKIIDTVTNKKYHKVVTALVFENGKKLI